ncbi:MAG: outer membrane beta-barrel protein [Terracidiphilus sp.]|jgi:opacity protein-like surface antigen
MRFKWLVPPIVTVGLFAATLPAFSQAVAPYQAKAIPWSIGVGPSSYDVDWGHGRMLGGTIWADWYPTKLQHIVRGLGVEIEARDISLNRNLPMQKNMRQDTAGGGPIYNWHITNRFRPYFKGLIEDGSVDFYPQPGYSHDTRLVFAPGGGFEYRFLGPLKVRADYEYQFWTGPLLGNTLNPQGFTVGIAYDLSHPQGR